MLGFIPCKGDTLLFFFHSKGITLHILVYVDDIIIASSSLEATNALLQKLEEDFTLRPSRTSLLSRHRSYKVSAVNSINSKQICLGFAKRAGMFNCKVVNMPLSTSEKLSAHVGELQGPNDATSYRSLVGGL
jgi:hypothetical protein